MSSAVVNLLAAPDHSACTEGDGDGDGDIITQMDARKHRRERAKQQRSPELQSIGNAEELLRSPASEDEEVEVDEDASSASDDDDVSSVDEAQLVARKRSACEACGCQERSRERERLCVVAESLTERQPTYV